MSVLIPHNGTFVGVRSADEPHPSEVCEDECFFCSRSICLQDQRAWEDIADSWMLTELLAEREEGGTP